MSPCNRDRDARHNVCGDNRAWSLLRKVVSSLEVSRRGRERDLAAGLR